MPRLAPFAALLASAAGQQYGSQQEEVHPPLTIQECTGAGCSTITKSITIDSNWRWLDVDATNCYTGNAWNLDYCPDTEDGAVQCAKECGLEGNSAQYETTYGVKASGAALEIDYVTKGANAHRARPGTTEEGTNVGSRNYLMNGTDSYYMFKLKNKEFTFDVDVSKLPCGLNGALYFTEMNEYGGYGVGDNTAGARYGTGYCDAQCPHDLKFIEGVANSYEWEASDTDPNAGTGHYGSCCAEMDIWEANSVSQAATTHPCNVTGLYKCEGDSCGDNGADRYSGVCDKDGCDLAPFRSGATDFFGEGAGFAVDTSKPMTVVTQFLTADGTDDGDLVEIKRIFVQDGKVIQSPTASAGGLEYNSITDDMCAAQKEQFGETNDNAAKGGMKAMGDAMARGMVLVMSLWDDHYAHMLWLDSTYPVNDPPTHPSDVRGSCATTSGDPKDVQAETPDSSVKFLNIKIGTIGSTFENDKGYVCGDGCNVCEACCNAYFDTASCSACVAAECA